MKNYFLNLRLWWQGWCKFHELYPWKPGWGPDMLKWKLLYGVDYLLCALIFAGPVTSISRYFGDYWGFEGSHFVNAGPPLWGSVRSAPAVRLLMPIFWILVVSGFWVLG